MNKLRPRSTPLAQATNGVSADNPASRRDRFARRLRGRRDQHRPNFREDGGVGADRDAARQLDPRQSGAAPIAFERPHGGFVTAPERDLAPGRDRRIGQREAPGASPGDADFLKCVQTRRPQFAQPERGRARP